ncbi:MAG TPA: hypothetical protein VKK19_15490 [Candidatus Dormibacteraeota bacterium]|nr:hypothetical protein [Candidatus Dormibacteraeota bacterium]
MRESPVRAPTTVLALAVMAVVFIGCGRGMGEVNRPPSGAPASPPSGIDLPSVKGLNYGGPDSANGEWLGTRWLRSGSGSELGWTAAKPRLQADLDFIVAHRLGQVQRVFIGLDQLMVWDSSSGFVRFDEAALGHLDEALQMFDSHHLKVIAVVFDQEETSSPGNFRFQALDGNHPAMRANYIRAIDQFFRRLGSRSTVVAWDLFNEPYNSLGTEGGLPRPPGADPVSPNYPDSTVHSWIRELYQTAKRAAPQAWLTVSDTTELYWKNPPDTAKYEGAVDFYDVHVYDDRPASRDWQAHLNKPYLLGEVGGDIDHGFKDQSVNSRVVSFWLSHARQLGISAVLAHAADGAVYTLSGGLTPTGRAVEAAQ